MRRLWAAGAAIVVCLASGGMPTSAQADVTLVTATQECDWQDTVPCAMSASDPRVTGPLDWQEAGGLGRDATPDEPGLWWTDATLQGPDGSWVGHSYLWFTPDAGNHVVLVLSGDGAYAGWQYIASGVDRDLDGSHDLIGYVYQGELPPWGPAQAGSPASSPGAPPSAAASPASDGPTAEELVLLAGLRLDLQGTCVPLRTDLPEAALAGVECRPPSEDVDRVRVYLFDTQADLLDTYLARLVAQGVEPGTASGRCVPGQGSEGPYVPSPQDGLLIAERGGCYVDAAGLAHYLATNPPFVLIELDGTTGDMAALEGWAWLGNEDQPGNPTIWRETPVGPEK